MILPFSTQINGKPTYFVEKIWTSLMEDLNYDFLRDYLQFEKLASKKLENKNPFIRFSDFKAKKTTIREDKNDRWKPGVMIDFFINARQKNMFRFAPRIPVVSTQRILMSYVYANIIHITINGKRLNDWQEKEKLAINDGFESWDDFVDYFIPIIEKSEDEFFTGKIIHWTDLRY